MLFRSIILNIITFFLFLNNGFSREYIFKWYNSIKVLDSIEFADKSEYQITLAEGSWEDNEGNYGFLKCLGPIIVRPNTNVDLEVFCNGFDHLENRFSLKLIRKSEYDVGIGEAHYLSGDGRYEALVNQNCKYAIKYIKEVTKGFYRHKCK